jgi:WD40 repeat protein
MQDNEPRRRSLIAIGITTELSTSGPRIIDSVRMMTQIFTSKFHYERATTLDIDPAREQIRREIRDFCVNCDEKDVVTLYYTGHADKVNGTHRLYAGDTTDRVAGTLETGDLVELMLVDTPLQCALVILDTCFAGKGGAEGLQKAVTAVSEGTGKTFAVLTAAHPREQIEAGDFVRLFKNAVDQRAVAGHQLRFLPLGALAAEMNKNCPGWQSISQSALFAKTDVLPFLPNPRFDPRLHDLDLLTQLRIEQGALREGELLDHFLPRARGVEVATESGWRFVGREAALRDLVSWLRNADNLTSRIVTGGPGSGKSAVIGRLTVLNDHTWRRAVPKESLAADTIPPEGSITASIHARGMTSAQVLAAISAPVGVPVARTSGALLEQMPDGRFTIAIDAIDEALDPAELVDQYLKPLVENGSLKGLRLLLGTRPHLVPALGTTGPVVNLDDKDYADPGSIYEYVLRRLKASDPQSPYHAASPELVAAIARAVAEAAGHSFLVALIVARTLQSVTELPEPADAGWRTGLPRTAAAAMHRDLETRLGEQADRARELLRPLAFAHGAGLPWENVWAPLAARTSGRDYTDLDLKWLQEQAGSYVIEATESRRSVYRLYHAALAEYLREGHAEDRIHGLFCDFLTTLVPRSGSRLDWSGIRQDYPYISTHLATHARQAGRLDQLLLDPGYLVSAGSAGLLAALPDAKVPDAVLAGRAYQRAIHQFRGEPADLSYLELAAQISKATELAEQIRLTAPDRLWSVPWTHWPPEFPHRVVEGHLGLVNDVICADPGDATMLVVSVGEDATVRLWDAATARQRGAYAVGAVPLVAVRATALRGQRNIAVLLAADGMLHTWDMLTATLLQTARVTPRWQRRARLREAGLELRCLSAPDGEQYAVVGGSGIRTTLWHVRSGHLVARLPERAAPEEVELTGLLDGRTAIVAALGGTDYRVQDFGTGQVLPHDQRRRLVPRINWLPWRAGARYYRTGNGPPVVAVRFTRNKATVWDLTRGYPLGTWRRGSPVQVGLTDGSLVSVPLPVRTPTKEEHEHEPGEVIPLGGLVRSQARNDRARAESVQLGVEGRGRFLVVEFSNRAGSLTLAGHTADVTAYDWAQLPDGQVIVVSAGRDGTIRRWDMGTAMPDTAEMTEQTQIGLHRLASTRLADGTPLGLTIADNGDATLWELRAGAMVGSLSDDAAPPSAVGLVRVAGGNPIAVTCGTDQIMRIWSLPGAELTAEFTADRSRWPTDIALAQLPDGTLAAVTSGHGRRAVSWDLGTGQMRAVLTGHRGWSTCATSVDGPQGPLALTGGTGNRVNVWDLRRGRRYIRFRVVSLPTFLAHPPTGRADAIHAAVLDRGEILAFVVTSDGSVRAVLPRRFPRRSRRAGSIPGTVVATTTLSSGQTVVITATYDGTVQVWDLAAFTAPLGIQSPLFEISLEVPVNDISVVDRDEFVLATPNGITAIRLDGRLLNSRVLPLEGAR